VAVPKIIQFADYATLCRIEDRELIERVRSGELISRIAHDLRPNNPQAVWQRFYELASRGLIARPMDDGISA
jgi:hypothetical protein